MSRAADCDGRPAFTNRRTANAAMRRLRRKVAPLAQLEVSRCRWCRWWHLRDRRNRAR